MLLCPGRLVVVFIFARLVRCTGRAFFLPPTVIIADAEDLFVRCLTCKCDLSNLTEHRCPGRGRAFDPDDSNTFSLPQGPIDKRRWVLWSIAILAILLYIFVLRPGVVLH